MAKTTGFSRPIEITHYCHAIECDAKVPPRLLMCSKHWRMVPANLKWLIKQHYVAGQEVRKDPTREYLEVMRRCQVAVCKLEEKEVPEFLKEALCQL